MFNATPIQDYPQPMEDYYDPCKKCAMAQTGEQIFKRGGNPKEPVLVSRVVACAMEGHVPRLKRGRKSPHHQSTARLPTANRRSSSSGGTNAFQVQAAMNTSTMLGIGQFDLIHDRGLLAAAPSDPTLPDMTSSTIRTSAPCIIYDNGLSPVNATQPFGPGAHASMGPCDQFDSYATFWPAIGSYNATQFLAGNSSWPSSDYWFFVPWQEEHASGAASGSGSNSNRY